MFDLVDILKTKPQDKVVAQELITTVLFHQTQECIDLVEEAFRFEGLVAPSMLENTDSNIKKHVRDSHISVVIVELNNSLDVPRDIERISHLLPNHASVIVIGSEDSISTIRNLKAMGFYYVFWPVPKQELIDFVRNVDKNRKYNTGLGKDREGKRVAIWGSKGGAGATLLTTEIALKLSAKRNSSCLIIDHDFRGGCLDIFLSLQNHEKKPVSRSSISASMDATFASSMAKKVSDMLSLLAIESQDLDELDLKEYVRALSSQLSGQFNFILEDLSRSCNIKQDLEFVAHNADIILLVIEPTVSSLREAKRVQKFLETQSSTARMLLVLNYTMAESAATISPADLTAYLGKPADVVCPYEPKLGKMKLDKQHLYDSKQPFGDSVYAITQLLLGLEVGKSRSLMEKLLKRGS
ncbi:MAG: chromosome partitioning protein ParA [Shewanella sp.]|nr:chromosome partitioning protein ParA [Shewanella sp.]